MLLKTIRQAFGKSGWAEVMQRTPEMHINVSCLNLSPSPLFQNKWYPTFLGFTPACSLQDSALLFILSS